jgi:hypothetical protein
MNRPRAAEPGDRVTYRGSLDEHHGSGWVVTSDHEELDVDGDGFPHRALRIARGPVALLCRITSVDPDPPQPT